MNLLLLGQVVEMNTEDVWALMLTVMTFVTTVPVALLVLWLIIRPPREKSGRIAGQRIVAVVSILFSLAFMTLCTSIYVFNPGFIPLWLFAILIFLCLLFGLFAYAQLTQYRLIRGVLEELLNNLKKERVDKS